MATVDLTGQPLQTGFNPDSLVLERYAKDAEKLSQQAQPTADLARNLAQAATNARQMQMELSKLPEVIQGLSRSLREAFQQSIQGAKEGAVSRGVTPGTAAGTSPILTSAVTAAVVTQVARAVQSGPTARDAITQITGAGPAPGSEHTSKVTRLARDQLDLNRATQAEIARAKIGIGPTKFEEFERSRTERPFESKEDVLSRKLGVQTKGIAEVPEPGVTPHLVTLRSMEALKQETAVLQERSQFAQSPKGVEVLRQEHRLRQDLQKQRITTEWNEMVAVHGRFGAEVKRSQAELANMGITLRGIGNIGAYAFTAGTAGILSMVKVADPVAFQTFQRSIEGVAASVGTIFGPTVMQMSEWLQNLADWFDSLDDTTKQWIARITVGAVAVGGFAMVISRLGPTLMVARTAMIAFSRTMFAFAATNPVIAGITALTLVVGGLATAWTLTRDRADDAAGAMGRAGRVPLPGAADRERRLREETRALPERIRRRIEVPGLTPEQITERLREAQAEEEKRIEGLRRAAAAEAGARARESRAQEIVTARVRLGPAAMGLAPLTDTGTQIDTAIRQLAPQIRKIFGGDMPAGAQARIWRSVAEEIDPAYARRVRVVPSPHPATAGLAQAEAVRNMIQEILTRTGGGTGGPRLSTQGLFPQSQVIREFAQLGEMVTIRSLERQGDQDRLLELKRISAILERVGMTLGVVADNTAPINLLRMGYKPGTK